MNKRFILTLFGIFILGFVVTMIAGSLATRKEPLASPDPKRAPGIVNPPSFPRQAASIQPSYEVAVTPPPTPAQLTTVTVAPSQNLPSLAEAIARRLGFAGNPQKRETSLGTIYRWKKQNTFLSVGGDPPSIAFAAPRASAVGFSQTPDELTSIARSFWEKIGASTSSVALEPSPPVYLAPVGFDPIPTEDPTKASLVELRFHYTIGGLPFFSRLPDAPEAIISLDPSGNVVSANILRLPAVSLEGESIAVASYGIALNRLATGDKVFVRASPDTSAYIDLLAIDVPLSTINQVELGYYYSPGSFVLAPVYVFYGSGQNKKTKSTIKTTTVVSAVP